MVTSKSKVGFKYSGSFIQTTGLSYDKLGISHFFSLNLLLPIWSSKITCDPIL